MNFLFFTVVTKLSKGYTEKKIIHVQTRYYLCNSHEIKVESAIVVVSWRNYVYGSRSNSSQESLFIIYLCIATVSVDMHTFFHGPDFMMI